MRLCRLWLLHNCASQTKRGLEKQIDKLQSALDCSNEDRRTSKREQEHTRELLEKELAEVLYKYMHIYTYINLYTLHLSDT